MIGADDIEDIVFQTLAQCLEILFRTERRIHLVVGVALYDVVAAEGKVMRADLGGNRNAGLSRLTHHIHALFGRAVAQMQVCTCLCGKYDISCNNRVLYGVCDARQMPLSRVCILIHAAAVYEVLVLAVSQHRNVFLCGNLHGLFVEQRVHNGFSVLADRRDAGFYHALDIGELFTLLSYCDGACLQYINRRKTVCFDRYIVDAVRAVDDRFCIRHRYQRCHASFCCCFRTAFNIFFICLPRVAEMYMHIDDARHYIAAFCIYYLRIFYTDSFFNPCNNAVFDQNITDFVFLGGRVDDLSIFD